MPAEIEEWLWVTGGGGGRGRSPDEVGHGRGMCLARPWQSKSPRVGTGACEQVAGGRVVREVGEHRPVRLGARGQGGTPEDRLEA